MEAAGSHGDEEVREQKVKRKGKEKPYENEESARGQWEREDHRGEECKGVW